VNHKRPINVHDSVPTNCKLAKLIRLSLIEQSLREATRAGQMLRQLPLAEAERLYVSDFL